MKCLQCNFFVKIFLLLVFFKGIQAILKERKNNRVVLGIMLIGAFCAQLYTLSGLVDNTINKALDVLLAIVFFTIWGGAIGMVLGVFLVGLGLRYIWISKKWLQLTQSRNQK